MLLTGGHRSPISVWLKRNNVFRVVLQVIVTDSYLIKLEFSLGPVCHRGDIRCIDKKSLLNTLQSISIRLKPFLTMSINGHGDLISIFGKKVSRISNFLVLRTRIRIVPPGPSALS